MSEPDLCFLCGNLFPAGQIGDCCWTDAHRLRAAASVIRRRSRKPGGFLARVLCRTLVLYADAMEPPL